MTSRLPTLEKPPNVSFRFEETKPPHRCCGQQQCLSLTEKVKKLVDSEILEVLLAQRYANREDNNQRKPENYRFVAYRAVFFGIYGRTRAKMSRKPLPSCVVLKIREMYPDKNNKYTGFQESKRQRKK